MWIDPQTLQVARDYEEARSLRPNWSGPSDMTDEMVADLGFVPVTLAAPGHDLLTQVATELPPALVDGAWTQQWEVTDLSPQQVQANLAAAVQKKNAEINAARLAANFSTFSYGGKAIACDTLSRSDIDGTTGYVSLFGTFAPSWGGGWKAVDNSYVPITTVEEWKAFYQAMYAQGQDNFLRAQALKQQLAAAASQDAIDAILW